MSAEAATHLTALRIAFADMWPGFDPADNWFTTVLSRRFTLVIDDEPEVLVYSAFGKHHQQFSCTRVFISFECRGWGFSSCDWAATSDHLATPRHYRLPLWATLLPEPFEQPRLDARAVLAAKVGFAATVVSNGSGTTRERVHDLLAAYREVGSGGRHRNNVGGPVADKVEFLRRHKFAMAFENSSYPGYTTEKLLHALQADTVPIYWGDPLVSHDFNTRRFVNYHDFDSEAAFVERVIELDRDDDAYCETLAEPWFPGGVAPACTHMDRFVDWFEQAVESESTPVAQRRWRPDTVLTRATDRWRIRQRYLGRIT